MQKDILFSIIVPTYNRANLILKTLDSVFAQTYTHYEVIVVDNASTDNTLEVLAPLEQQGKIKVLKLEHNQERSVSRNNGMAAAKGDFLTLLDSDDLMYPDNLADAREYILANPESRFFHNLYHLVDTDGKIIYNYRFRSNTKAIRSIANGNFLSCIGVFVAREIYTNYRFETNPIIIGSEDWEMWMRILAKYPLGRIKKINSAIVHHPGRSISSYSLESVITRKKFIIEKIKSDPELFSAYRKQLNSINGSAYLFAASLANTAGMYEEARKYLKIAFVSRFLLIFDIKFWRVLQIATFRMRNKYNI
jgi:glycosyltransferase involved in cell wall biosynthesis